MNQQRRKLALWSPHNSSQFIVGANDLRLYAIDEEKMAIRVLNINSEVQLFKCFAWCPDAAHPNQLAVGLANGKVVLTSTSVSQVTKEFVPRHSRTCNALAWNPIYSQQIAAGLDKVRSDHSTIIWDITRTGVKGSFTNDDFTPRETPIVQTPSTTLNVLHTDNIETVNSPYVEVANSEATHALAWLPGAPNCLAIGTAVKWLRIYDLRTNLKSSRSVVAHSKAVLGVNFDPFNSNRLTTFSEDGQVKIWDIKNLSEPTLTINTGSKGLLQVGWCPTRSGILATISKEDSCIKLWNVANQQASLKGAEETGNFTLNKPHRIQQQSEPLSSLAWHASSEGRLLTVTQSGIVEVITLHEPIPVSWSSNNTLCYTVDKKVIEVSLCPPMNQEKQITSTPTLRSLNTESDLDISCKIRQRAKSGYSLDIETNLQLSSSFSHDIKQLWAWIYNTHRLRLDLGRGIYYYIVSSAQAKQPIQSQTTQNKIFPQTYHGIQRNLALQLCGWDFCYSDPQKRTQLLSATLSKLEQQGQYEKAVALAIFHHDIPAAIAILQRVAESSPNDHLNLKLVAMALAGYSSNESSVLWRETCTQLREHFKHPYLRAAFAFLCYAAPPLSPIPHSCLGTPPPPPPPPRQAGLESAGDMETLYSVLKCEISLWDKIAFACRYLPDTILLSYIDKKTSEVVQSGNLEGIALTGLSQIGMDLLERYVDKTADVQTACLCSHFADFKEPRVTRWMETYRQLLNCWQLWHERAKLDIERKDTDQKPAQVYARCTYCSHSLALPMLLPSKSADHIRGRGGASLSAQQKIASCPSCRKALPRCAVCLQPMNCVISPLQKLTSSSSSVETGSLNFDTWFTWCLTCRHGGHARHIIDWFSQHSECPVSDCNCNCMAL